MMLEVRNLSGGYGKGQVLFDMSFSVEAGQAICLLGRNGMGKTTTVKTLMGLLPAWAGEISFDGASIARLPAARIARRGLGLVPEGRQVFPNLTAHENLVATASNRLGTARPWTADRIYELFPGLHARRSAAANLLSGGEQQMLAIGRALMTNPRLLVLDEATEGLAPVIRDQIWACLSQLRAVGQSIIVIDKHIKRLAAVVDTFYVVERGRIAWSGPAGLVRSDPGIVDRYLSV
jgi:branched-chain amino acid transport system ATP-binding protein